MTEFLEEPDDFFQPSKSQPDQFLPLSNTENFKKAGEKPFKSMAKNSNNEYESKYEPNLYTNLINKYYPDNSSDSDEGKFNLKKLIYFQIQKEHV